MKPTDHALRTLTSDCGILTQSDGSCVFNLGDTSIMAAVYGPTEVRANRERLDRSYVELVYKPKTGMPGCADKAMEKTIRNTCETAILTMLHPRTSINVILQELQNCGSLLSCCINASCQALLDAAIPLKFTIAAVCCVITDKGEIIVDPTDKQEEEGAVQLTFVFESRDRHLISCACVGQCSSEQLQTCLLTCKKASEDIFSFYRESMTKKLERNS